MQTSINIVPLVWALFCGSCEAISDSKTDQCPACGAWGNVSAFVAFGESGDHDHFEENGVTES